MCWLVRFLVNLGQDRTNSVIWLFIFELMCLNFKMTKIKKTLGRNWTCYHNYYGMTHILEKACSKKLHWNRETIREYTVSHAPEVNYKKSKQHVDDPPPLPENNDDDWFRWHPRLPGSGKVTHKQPQPKVQKKKGKAKGGVKKFPPAQ